ncbi:1-aminocyclopropane-1-carboxylate deaminase/D-cysteine desulfhydrase [Tenacibaculum sp. MEBiC06402]|uniref:1-aminocyclopropane-1-carboxylate deaminase/D-cysteine desulfhydrase n=1 Tax=unclassified Tenacibaculum TaxID=2635139 RepID=UPI003B9985B9
MKVSGQFNLNIKNQQIHLPFLEEFEVELWMKREDQIHPEISGNKFRKLKYNVVEASKQNKQILLTFGGAYSNHILATAATGKLNNLQTIGVIRGEELASNLEKVLQENQTLAGAKSFGMEFEFVSREVYKNKSSEMFLNELKKKFGDFYLIPEGGTNILAIKGCEEILTVEDEKFDYICLAVGTGGTISGIINSVKDYQNVIGFPALKGDFLRKEIKNLISSANQWNIEESYHFGGYGKFNSNLIHFINEFKEETSIQLDPIYTGKMMFGVIDLIKRGKFPKGTKILTIHTGGIQGISGVNKKLRKKNLEEIKL